jgi:hypothetical protein
MKNIFKSISVLLLILSTSLFSQTIKQTSLNQIMQLSGLNKQVSQYPALAVLGIEQAQAQGSSLKDEDYSKMKQVMLDSFKPKDMLSTVSKEIQKTTTQESADEILIWYKSDLGRKITKAEEKASTPSAYEQMIKQASKLLTNKKRVYLARMIERSLNATEMTIQIQNNTSIAVYSAMSKIMAPEKKVDIEAFKIIMSAQEKQMRANIEQFVILSFVYSYKDMSVQEIEEYVVFLKKPHTKKFNKSVVDGLVKALSQATLKMAKNLN